MSTTTTAATPTERLDALLGAHEKEVFYIGKDGCKYCDMLEADLNMMKIPFARIKNLEQELVEVLKGRLEYKTFPMLFFGGLFVGGFNAFQKLCYTGEIQRRLKDELGIEVDYEF